jgi:hypothetical protein
VCGLVLCCCGVFFLAVEKDGARVLARCDGAGLRWGHGHVRAWACGTYATHTDRGVGLRCDGACTPWGDGDDAGGVRPWVSVNGVGIGWRWRRMRVVRAAEGW